MFNIVSFLAQAIKFSTIFIFGAVGEILTEKSGHLNMGIPGIMCLGALGGLLGESIYISSVPASSPLNGFMIVFVPIIFAMIFASLGGLLFAFFSVTLRCNQNVTGLTLTTFGVGFSCYFIGEIKTNRMAEAGLQLQSMFKGYDKLGWFGDIFLSQSAFTYLAIIIAVVCAVILSKTRIGLNLRAVGENPAAADSASINVNAYRYIATIIGAAIAGIGGIFFELDKAKGMFNPADGIDAYGWLALCLVIFSLWKSSIAIGTSFVFACFSILPDSGIQFPSNSVRALFRILPYLITIIILIIISIRNKKENQPPNALGQSYFREDR